MFFRSCSQVTLYERDTHVQAHTDTCTHKVKPSTPPHPTPQQSPLAPTHLMFSQYYVKTDTHNCAGTASCFCWQLSTTSIMSLTEVSVVTGTTRLQRSTLCCSAFMTSCLRDFDVGFPYFHIWQFEDSVLTHVSRFQDSFLFVILYSKIISP